VLKETPAFRVAVDVQDPALRARCLEVFGRFRVGVDEKAKVAVNIRRGEKDTYQIRISGSGGWDSSDVAPRPGKLWRPWTDEDACADALAAAASRVHEHASNLRRDPKTPPDLRSTPFRVALELEGSGADAEHRQECSDSIHRAGVTVDPSASPSIHVVLPGNDLRAVIVKPSRGEPASSEAPPEWTTSQVCSDALNTAISMEIEQRTPEEPSLVGSANLRIGFALAGEGVDDGDRRTCAKALGKLGLFADAAAPLQVHIDRWRGKDETFGIKLVRLRVVMDDRGTVLDELRPAWGDQDQCRDALAAAVRVSSALKMAGPRPAAAPAERPISFISPRAAAISRPKAVVIAIGIGKYHGALPPATGAVEDAKLFADFSEVTLGVPRANIHLLVDADATQSSIRAQLDQWLPRNASSEVFFYYAGHGAPDPSPRSAKRYLVPWDADPKSISAQGIALDSLLERLASLKAAHVYVLLDACFSGAGGRSLIAAGTRPVVIEHQTRLPPRRSIAVFAATRANEITGAGSSGHGLFTQYLLRGLNGEADQNRDGAITFGELEQYTRTHVANDARRDNRDQEPQLTASEGVRGVVLTRLPPPR
jgi:hypothetical protein